MECLLSLAYLFAGIGGGLFIGMIILVIAAIVTMPKEKNVEVSLRFRNL